MKTSIYILIVSLFIVSCKTKTDKFVEINHPLVYDSSNIFSKNEKDSLSKKIITFESLSTNEICVYTIDSIPNHESALFYATMKASELGVGKKEKNNGILILISKYDRQIGIVTGFGTEKIITDHTCKVIIDSTIVPKFKDGNYYTGINNALDSIIKYWK